MDQLLRLLRAKCAYCNRLKMPRVEVNRFCCKLRLVRFGLLKEAEELEELQLKRKTPKGAGADRDVGSDNLESDESDDGDTDVLVQRRNDFVKRAIKRTRGSTRHFTSGSEKIEAAVEERRMIIKEFLAAITKVKTCGSCNGSVIDYDSL